MVMAWIIAIVAVSLVMTVLTISELRWPVTTSTVQLPELAVADRVISLVALGTFTLAIINGLILLGATLP
jgi:hypothetical protein